MEVEEKSLHTVDGNAHEIADFLNFAASQAEGPEIPEHEMVVSTASLQLIAMRDKGIGESSGVGDDLLSVGLPFGSGDLVKSSGDSSDSLTGTKSE